MADRTVSVRLQAEVGSYIAGMSKASAATMRLGESATTAGSQSRGAFDLAGKGPLLFGAAVVAGLGMAIGKSMEFERSMSAVSAATGEGAAALESLRDAAMQAGADTQYSATEAADAITELAKAGVSTADIMGGGLTGALDLAAAGQLEVADAAGIAAVAMTQFKLSGEDLPHVADLLAAGAGKAMGSVDDLGQALNQAGLVASAAGLSIEETTGTLSAFASAGLIGSDAGTSLKTMLQRLQNPSEEAAGTMRDLGISMYDANGNFVGMESLAGQLHDGMSDLTPAVRDAAMATIFGSDAVRAANVLYAEGAEGIGHWTDAVDDQGYATEQAAALTDNLSGDLERLSGSFDTLLITIGGGLQGPLRGLTQFLGTALDGVTSAANVFGDLPGPIQGAIGAFGAWAIAGDKVTGMFGKVKDALAPMGEAASGIFSSFGEALNYAKENGDGLGTVLGSVGETAMDAAGGGLKALGKAIGPELGMAAAAYGVGLLVEAFTKSERVLQQATEQATDWQKALNEGGAAAAGVADDIDATVRSSEKFRTTMAGLSGQLGTTLADIEGPTQAMTEGWEAAEAASRAYFMSLSPVEQATQKQTEWENNLSYAISEHGRNSEEARTAQERYAYWTNLAAVRSGELTGAIAEATGGMAGAESATGTLNDSMALLGDTTGLTEEQITDAQTALQDWRDNAQSILASFTDPLAIYSQQMQDAATAVADSTTDSSDSWSDYVDSVDFDLDAYAASLEEQNARQEEWRRNIVLVTQRGGEEVGNILFNMGAEGAGLVTAMVNANDAEFNRMKDGMITDARFAGEGAVRELQAQMVAMAIVGASGGQATIQGLSAQLGLGVDVVRGIAAQYGISLAEGVNPILTAVGQPTMNLLQFNGPYRARGGPIAGPGTGTSDSILAAVSDGEYVVRAASVSKYGMDFLDAVNQGLLPAFATGGFVSVAAIPRPPSTAPTRPPISSAGDGTMGKAYNAVAGWLPSKLEPPAASGGSSTGLIPIMAAARQYVMDTYGIRNIGGFAKRNIIGTNTPSDHSMGKAIDIMTTNLGLGWQIANDFAYGPAHGKFRAENVIWQQSISSNGGKFAHMADRGSPTQNHRDHVHVDTYDSGGWLRPGYTLAYNGTGQNERVLTGREWSGSSGGGGGGSVSVAPPVVKVFLDGHEWRGIARVEAQGVVVDAVTGVNRAVSAVRPN